MAEKMSTMVLKVDLDCSKCYNKLRRTLCRYYYEIRSQVIDPKAKTVTISGPFDPQTFAKKLNDKAGKVIKGIEIKKKEEEKPKQNKPADPKPADKPKQAEAADKPKQAAADKPKQADPKPADKPQTEKAADKPKKAEEAKSADPPKQAAAAPAHESGPAIMKLVEPGTVLAYPMVQPPYGMYSTVPVYEGYGGGGPIYDGYGRPINYDGYGGNRVYDNGNGGYNNNNNNYASDYYFSEKDPTCTIM